MKFRLIVDPTGPEEVIARVHSRSDLTDRLEAMVLEYTGSDGIPALGEDEWIRLRFDQIECVTVQNGKTYAIDQTGKSYRLKQRLYELEQLLPTSFIRINKSSLANENRLERFVATYSGGINARFQSGYEEYVSRRCFAIIKRRFDSK